MTNKFETNFKSPDGSKLELFLDEPKEGTRSMNPPGFLKKLMHAGESADWVFVEAHISRTMSMPIGRGWMKVWGIGDPLPDVPQVISGEALTFAAVTNELDPQYPSEQRIAAEFLLALFILENQIDASIVLTKDQEFSVSDTLPDPDFRGGFAVTTAQWDAFIAAEGPRLNWSGNFLRELVLPQMRCANWLAHSNRKRLGVAFGGSPTEPFIPRMIDLFMAHLIGDVAAAEVVKMERNAQGMGKKIRTIIRDSNSWSDASPDLTKLFENREAYLGAKNGSGNGLRSVEAFIKACQAALDPALSLAREMLDVYLPGFAVTPANSGEWMKVANEELKKWSAGWSEQAEPGLSAAIAYFEATDYEPKVVINPGTGELTHWCGAFVASCMKAAGAPVPKGSAAAASWRNWGDKSLAITPGSNVPAGAVVTTGGGAGSNHIGHVTLFVRWEGTGDRFWGLGGNQTDGVTVAKFATNRIVDIRILADKTSSSAKDIEILAKTLWGEIRGGTDEQVINVANVILNRHLTSYRSNGSIAGACLSHKQFSCWNPGTQSLKDIESLVPTDPQLRRLVEMARQVIDSRLDNLINAAPLGGARHYHNHHVNPDWAVPAKIVHDDGKHIFYRDIA